MSYWSVAHAEGKRVSKIGRATRRYNFRIMTHEYWKVACKNEKCKRQFDYKDAGDLQVPIALRRCLGSVDLECPYCKQTHTYGDQEIRLLP